MVDAQDLKSCYQLGSAGSNPVWSTMNKVYIGNNIIEYNGIRNGTLEECIDYLKDKSIIGIDIETSRKFLPGVYQNEDIYQPGLDPYLSRVVMLQIGDTEKVFIIDTRVINIQSLIDFIHLNDKILFVGHNLKFEQKHLYHNFGLLFKNIYDTMLVEMIQTNGLDVGYSLQALAYRHLNIRSIQEVDLFTEYEEDQFYLDKSTRLGFLNIGDSPFTQTQVDYGGDDIWMPLKIRELQIQKSYYPEVCIWLENQFCLSLSDIELRGIKFDPNKWLEVYRQKLPIYKLRLDFLNKYIESNHSSFCSMPDLFGYEPKCNIMWSSSDQVVKFFRHLGICPKEKSKQTKKLEWTVGAKALLKILPNSHKELFRKDLFVDNVKSTDDFVLNYLLMKTSEQSVTTFGKEWLKYLHPVTGRVHSNYRQILNTGRISSTNPNLQNLPNTEQYRSCFTGYLINADYSSQESRVLASVSKDPSMLSFFNDGHPLFKDDYHSWVATMMFRVIRNEPELVCLKDTHPKERQDAKAIGFKISYGGSAFTLKDDFGVEEDIAQKFIDGYLDAYPTLKKNFEEAKALAVKLGYIEIDPITKRRWFDKTFDYMNSIKSRLDKAFPEDYRSWSKEKREEFKTNLYKEQPDLKELWSTYFSLKGKLERNALNYRIQGPSASQTKLAAIYIRDWRISNNCFNEFFLTNLIHDETLSECVNKDREKYSKIVKEAMESAGSKICSNVTMKAESYIVDYWHHN